MIDGIIVGLLFIVLLIAIGIANWREAGATPDTTDEMWDRNAFWQELNRAEQERQWQDDEDERRKRIDDQIFYDQLRSRDC